MKIRFLGQKIRPVGRARTDGHTDTQSDHCGHPFRVSGFFPSTYHQGSAQLTPFRPQVRHGHAAGQLLVVYNVMYRFTRCGMTLLVYKVIDVTVDTMAGMIFSVI